MHLNLALELKRVMYFCILRVCSPFFWIFPCSPGRGWLLREHASFPLGAFTSGSFFCTRSSGTAGVEGGRLRKGLRQEKPEPTGDQDSRRSGVEYRPVRSPGCKFGVLWVWPTAAPRLGLPQCLSRARATTPMMRHVVSREPWAVEICGVFLHPIQPLAHEGLAQHILFDIHKMSSPI